MIPETKIRPMKVLLITPWYPTRERPGYGAYVRELARTVERFAEVTVLHLDGHRRPRPPKLISVEQDHGPESAQGITVFRARWSLTPRFLPNLPMRLSAALLAYRHIAAVFPPDLLHANVFTAGLVAGIIGRFARIPVVITEHSTKLVDPAISNRALLEARLAYLLADAVLPVSNYLNEEIRTRGLRGSFTVIPNSVDTGLFRPESGPRRDSRSLLFVGALRGAHGKGLPHLLRACRLLHDRGQAVELEILGDGPTRATNEQLASDLGLSAWVTFRGAVSSEEVAGAMQRSRLLVMPSTMYETFCVPLAEAQACGLPSVASRNGAIPETLGHHAGVLVKPGEPAALAAGIDEALERHWDHDLIVRGAQRYSQEAVALRLREAYQRATMASGHSVRANSSSTPTD